MLFAFLMGFQTGIMVSLAAMDLSQSHIGVHLTTYLLRGLTLNFGKL